VTLSVLVATCPCALGLATPAALAASTEGLARRGFVITRAHVLEALARVDRVVFDKTGTLTQGRPRLEQVVALRSLSEGELVDRAARLEAGSNHVLARAFGAVPAARGFEAVEHVTGRGVEGKLEARRHRLGHPEWVMSLSGAPVPSPPDRVGVTSWVLLADEEGALGWLGLGDPLRAEARPMIQGLQRRGLAVELLSGDPSPGVADLARSLGVERRVEAALPEEKLKRVRALQASGECVAFVGDGLNDGPVAQAADVSIVMGGGCDRTRLSADALLWNDDLACLPEAVDQAARTQRVIRQNFAWAIGYNACVLPLAVSGQLAPWLAAVGMSLSSLVVVVNSARLRRWPPHDRGLPGAIA
jgi:Cu2+-exporting ATPase